MSANTYRSVPDMLRSNATEFKNRLALKYRKQGVFVTLTYAAYYERVLMVARGLAKMRVKPGDRIAILSENRAGWVIADMGILCTGSATVPIYPTNTPEQIEYMINHSGARIIFVSGKFQYTKLLKVREAIPGLELVVSFERFLGDPSLPVTTFYQLSEIDSPITDDEKTDIEAGIDQIAPNDMLTLIYTSGTTGVPKGVVLSHRNILINTQYLTEQSGAVTKDDVLLSFLPLSHILERTAGYYTTIRNGALLAFADSIEKVPENMFEIRPTVMVSVPRLFEKIFHRIFENAHQMPALKRSLFHWGVDVGKKYVEATYIKKQPSALLNFKYAIADRLIFSKIRAKFGGNMKLFCSGGAPLDKSINEFFWVLGIPIFEGYGLTETSPALCFNSFEHIRFGSVGFPLKETEFRIAGDGEILVKGPQVMCGYYNDPTSTTEAIQDGWFKTGDIGHIEDGYIFITDRKKELIITAGGKNIAPQPIENELKMDKYVSSAFVYGDRKPYLTALIVPNLERLLEFAKEKHIHYYELDDLVMHEPVQKLFSQRLADINSRLAPYETIKKFVLLAHDFSIEGGELTPTLKLRRKVIYEKYKHRIEDMYTDHNN
ncbi:MAG: long-chain fatty acid--CoA ligase [Desulfuromonadaceae bacterium]|nr:long-chain fatty acid--CoA ligase [Desulfuromonadaceae bacterium]MDD5104470.1 long-chain fatty acid--CoA ligase [Desulfuromonadaceae bacterium]